MNKPVMTKFQPSITEWFATIGELKEAEAFRKEDNTKSDRLEALYKLIGLTYERPQKLEARDLVDMKPLFARIIKKRGNELCAIRLVPKKNGLPKLRHRGLSIKKCYETWFLKQKINYDNYEAHICPHPASLLWSIIFVVNKEAIFGEIIKGRVYQLTYGNIYHELYQFRSDFKNWQISKNNPLVLKRAKKIVDLIKVSDKRKQNLLKKRLKVKFSHNYMTGYFEATVWPGNKIYYIDYNRFLARYISTPPPFFKKRDHRLITGVSSYPGLVKGQVVVVKPSKIKRVKFPAKSVLVCNNTDVRYIPLMKKAGAIITDRGSILSHASIVSRELKIPCIIDTKIATQVLKTRDTVEVDATKGIVKKI